MAARAADEQGPDPDPVPQHRVLRQRRVRDPGRVRDLLRHRAARAHPVAGGHARRSDRRAGRLRPRPSPGTVRATPQPRAHADARPRHDRRGGVREGERLADRPRPHPGGRDALRRALVRRLREGVVPVEPALRRDASGSLRPPVRGGPEDRHHGRPAPAARRREGDRVGAHRTGRPLRSPDGDRPPDRLRAGDGRRPRLLERGRRLRAHQPRDRRRHRSPGRVGVQAVRARRGARTRDPEDAAAQRLHGAHPAAGRDVLGAAQRRGRRLRDDLAGERHRQLGQRRVREPALADRGRRSLRGRRRARRGRRADGHPVLPPHHRAERPARGRAGRRPGRERGEHARDGLRVRHARGSRRSRAADARDLGDHVRRGGAVPGSPARRRRPSSPRSRPRRSTS